MNDENELFLKQMKGVTQIKKSDRLQNIKTITPGFIQKFFSVFKKEDKNKNN